LEWALVIFILLFTACSETSSLAKVSETPRDCEPIEPFTGLTADAEQIHNIAISADDKWLLADFSSKTYIWRVQDQQLVLELDGYAVSTFLPPGNTVVSARDQSLKVLSIMEQKTIHEFDIGDRATSVGWKDVVVAPDKPIAAVINWVNRGVPNAPVENWVTIVDVSGGGKVTEVGRVEGDSISAIALSGDGKFLAIGRTTEATIDVWDLSNRSHFGQFKPTVGLADVVFTRRTAALAISRDGSLLASAHGDGKIRIWNLPGRKEVGTFAADSPDSQFKLRFTSDARLLIAIAGGSLFVLDMRSMNSLCACKGEFSAHALFVSDTGTTATIMLRPIAADGGAVKTGFQPRLVWINSNALLRLPQ
jgi:WD40 repeat protein